MICVFLLIFFYSKNCSVDRKPFTRFLCVFVFLIFFGFRGFIGSDWSIYYYVYTHSYDISYNQTSFEPLFMGLIYLCNNLGLSYYDYIFLLTFFISIALDYFFYRYSPNYVLGWIALLGFGGFTMIVDLQRNMLAICFFIFSLPFLFKRKIVPYILLNFIGTFFHSSSILYIFFYFISNTNFLLKRKILMVIFIISTFLFVTGIGLFTLLMGYFGSVLGQKYVLLFDLYLQTAQTKTVSIGFLERTVMFLLIIIYLKQLIKFDRKLIVFLNMYIIYFITYYLFCDIEVVALRISSLFKLSYWILIPALYYVIRLKNNRKIYVAYISIYSVLWLIGTTSNIDFKYENQITGTESYTKRLKETGRKELV